MKCLVFVSLLLCGCSTIIAVDDMITKRMFDASPYDEYAQTYGFTNYQDEARKFGRFCHYVEECRQFVREQYNAQYRIDSMSSVDCMNYDPNNQHFATPRQRQQFYRSIEYLKCKAVMEKSYAMSKMLLESGNIDARCGETVMEFVRAAEWLNKSTKIRMHDNCKPNVAITLRWYLGEL